MLPELAESIITAIGSEVAEYRRPLEGPFGRALRVGVEQALARFVEHIEHPEADDGATREIYVALGRGEMRAGRSLDALLSAYRLGARLAWERFVAAGAGADHQPETLYRLASAIFSYIDAISAESVEGYAQERAAAEGERQRRRRALARLLARDDVSEDEVLEVARDLGWRRPAAIAGLVASTEAADRLGARLGDGALTVAEHGVTIGFVPDPDGPGRRAQIGAALDGVLAALGPAVALGRAHHSLGRAHAAHTLALEGRLRADGLVIADDHLPALLLHGGDAGLAADLAERALAPLEGLKPGARGRLEATLRAWLDHPGQIQRIAADLHVHPQTVRYRLGRLRELFGDALDDADRRFELSLALRAG